MTFEFSTAGRVLFGAGVLAQVGAAARQFGHHALVVTGRSTDRARSLIAHLDAAGIRVSTFQIAGEPDVPAIERGRAACRESEVDLVIGIGGGSALDAAKAIGGLAANTGEALDYLEVVGRGRPLEHPSLPCIAIPTTAGTGSEATKNAVIGAPEQKVKVSLRHPSLLPRVAVIDPDLTLDLPRPLTAATGLDALTQLIEAYVSVRANPMTDAICAAGIPLAASALPAAVHNGSDRAARAGMSLASFWSGLALANAGLGAVHGFAGPIGGRFDAPHGAVCASLLPHVMAVNLAALRSRAPDSPAIRRFENAGRWMTSRPAANADDAVSWTREITERLEIPTLSHFGISTTDIPDVIDQASRASSMKANPIVLTADELREIIERAL
jgi:alcohol dehydrogenase class IV